MRLQLIHYKLKSGRTTEILSRLGIAYFISGYALGRRGGEGGGNGGKRTINMRKKSHALANKRISVFAITETRQLESI